MAIFISTWVDKMRLQLSFLALSSSIFITSAFDPFQNGPYNTKYKNFLPFLTSGLDHMVDVWVPDTDEIVETPIIYFVGGLGGIIPGDAYKNLMAKIASHGISIIQPSMLGNNPIDNYEGIWLDDIMEWVEVHLRQELADAGVHDGLILDHSNLFIMGHSAGGHVAVEYLKHHCGSARGSILLSPVDGFDPFGLIPIDAVTPGEYLNYAVPSLILMAGLDNVKGIDNLGNLVPACAPTDLSNKRFYDAFPDNSWLVNATDFGHGDVLDDFYADAVHWTHFCATATDDKSNEDYRRQVAGQIVSFIKYVLGQESCDVLQYLQDPSLFPVTSTEMNKASVLNPDGDVCDQTECKWQTDPYPH